MKDEIKEINIKRPGQILDYVDTKEHLLELFNYITNLQKERNMFKNSFETMSKNYFEEKSRNEKAIEYIKKYCIDDEFYINLTNKEKNIIDVLNILQDGE